MTFKAPIKIKVALHRMHRHDSGLPPIQYGFVWGQDAVQGLLRRPVHD